MLTLSDIRKSSIAASFRKGQEIQQAGGVKNFQYSVYTVNDVTTVDMEGQVREKNGAEYHVELSVDEEYDDITNSSCKCDDMFQLEGLCKHCIAVLSEYIQKRTPQEIYDVKWKKEEDINRNFSHDTNGEMKEILNKFAMKGTSRYLLPEVTRGSVQIVPYVETYSKKNIHIEFKIGIDQMYVLKNIPSFLTAIEESQKVHYGKKLDFYHNMEAFTEESQKLIEFLKAQHKESMRISFSHTYYGVNSAPMERSVELDEAGIERFFSAMKGEYFEGIMLLQEDTVFYVSPEEAKPKMLIHGDSKGITITLETQDILYGSSRYYYLEKGVVYPGNKNLKKDLGEFLEFLLKQEMQQCYIAASELPAFCKNMLPLIRLYFELTVEQFEEAVYLPEKPEFELYLDKLEHDVIAGKLVASYKGKKYNVLESTDLSSNRNVEEEMFVRKAVEVYFNAIEAKGSLFLIKHDEELLYQLLSGGLQRLSELTAIYTTDAFGNMKIRSSPNVSIGVSVKSNLLELEIQSNEIPMDQLADLLSKYNRKKKYIRLKNGDFLKIGKEDGIDLLAEMKEDLHLTDSKFKKGKVLVPKYRAMYLDSALHSRQVLRVEKDRTFKSVVRNMKTVEDSDYEIPQNLKLVLREYQKNGFLWLKTLQENGFGGILADDMGLGKTLQVISLLEAEAESPLNGECQPVMIVCPASLVYNWKKEIQRFAPHLSTVIVEGSVPEREEIIQKSTPKDILITSYDLLKRDVEAYENIIFSVQVIDEAQYIKNASTQAAKGVKKIDAAFKLALTGTPIENRLSELWSIFDFVMPGFLYSYAHFKEEIEIPIVVNKDENKMERLQKMIRPFILRRLKGDVLKDLPEKIEENVFTKLEGEQLHLYDAHIQKIKETLNTKTDSEFSRERFQILAELTKLRQLCCDPSLVYEEYKAPSAKTDMCMELIQNAVNSGHKILLFSQFTTMLEHLQKRLDKENIGYYTLTGSVNKEKRMKLVDAFNQDDTPVFCISLKAGGTGLNLTAADIVIHYDPWWNVAVQNQATDRAHRIGQENVVTVYKLVTQGTIEEKIIEMQEKKKELAQQVLEGSGMDTISFTREELLDLLSY